MQSNYKVQYLAHNLSADSVSVSMLLVKIPENTLLSRRWPWSKHLEGITM